MSQQADAAAEAPLLQALRAGDDRAYGQLVELHHGAMLRVARLFVSSQAVAEEVVQDTWVAVITGLDRFEGRSSLKTWMFRILANRARTRAVREGRSIPMSSMAPEPAVDPDRFADNGRWRGPLEEWDAGSPEHILMNQRAHRRLLELLEDLPEGQRAVVTLRDVVGLDAQETCNVLQISETNQRVLLHRARSRLRAALEEHFGQG